MSTFLYTRPTDRVRGTVTVADGDGIADAAYPPENLDLDQPDLPAKLTTINGAWTRNVGFAARVDFVAIIHHNFVEGLGVRLQGNSAPIWTTPVIDVPFVVPAPYLDDYRANVWLDLTSIPSRTLQYWRLHIVGSNAAPVAVGEWALYSRKRNFGIRNISRGSERRGMRPSIVHETDYLVRRTYPMQTGLRSVTVSMEATDATLHDIEEWRRSALGQALPFVIVPHSAEVDAWFVTFEEQEQSYTRAYPNINNITLMFKELSRGLHL